ncbi:S24 family peptidase [Sodalis sp. C49]|uniref:S24 family peptidase n=1 Tax=Sodalis sp. C49 TaxID=3228929 RepID=UPI003965D339
MMPKFTSPAADYLARPISLDETCISRPAATYMFRVNRTMIHAGIFKDAILVVDSSRKAVSGSIIVADVGVSQLVRRLHLVPEIGLARLDTGYNELVDITDVMGEGINIFGMVTFCVNDITYGEFDDNPVM